MITPRPPRSFRPGSTFRLLGDSIGAGSAATTIGTTDVLSLICADLGLTPQNNCVSGSGAHAAVSQAYAIYQPFGDMLAVVNGNESGHNDGVSLAAGTPAMVGGEDRAWYAEIWAKTDVAASDAALAKSGSWSASATDWGDKASARLGGTPMESSTSGDTLSWTASSSRDVFINCASGKGSTGRRVGSFDVKKNGVVVDSYAGDGQSDCSFTPLTRHARFIFDVSPGDFLEIVCTGGPGPTVIASVGTLRRPCECEEARRMLPPRPNPACLNGSGFYVIGGVARTGTIAGFDAIDAEIVAANDVVAGRGYPGLIARSNAFLTGGNMPGPDFEHPIDPGHFQLYRSLRETFLPAGERGTWSPTLTGFTGVSACVGEYRASDGVVVFSVRVLTGGAISTAGPGSATISLPPGFPGTGYCGGASVVSEGASFALKSALINSNNAVYMCEAVSVVGGIVVSGAYLTS